MFLFALPIHAKFYSHQLQHFAGLTHSQFPFGRRVLADQSSKLDIHFVWQFQPTIE